MNKTALFILPFLVLLGNGLRSVISSAVFVSEGEFASFLSISITKTSAIIELLLGAVLLSLLVSPFLMRRINVSYLACIMCALAGNASLGLATIFWISPPVATREIAVVILFPLVGFALASLAPIAQLWTNWGGERWNKMLTGVWAMAMPAAFLVTPQVVRVIAPRYGLDLFFTLFALLLFLMIPFILFLRNADAKPAKQKEQLHSAILLPSIAVLILFEFVTLLITLDGITSVYLFPAIIGFAASLLYFRRVKQKYFIKPEAPDTGRKNSYIFWLFAFLFLTNVATTGFYDTAYLIRHMCSNTLIADRATISALAQVSAAIGTTALLARFAIHHSLMAIGTIITFIGLSSFLLYENHPLNEIYYSSKTIVGFGVGMLTTATIFAVTNSSKSGSSLSLFIAFIIIIGTEFGLEFFEIFTQITNLITGSHSTPYVIIFVIQAAVMAFALAPLGIAFNVKNRK